MNAFIDIQNKIAHHHLFQKYKELMCLLNPDYDYHCYCMNKEQLKEYNELQIEEIKIYATENNLNIEEAVIQWSQSHHSKHFRTMYHIKKMFSLY